MTVARDIRQTSDAPIIMITAKGVMIDRIVGLEVGADDYIAKPFHLREVLARVRSVLRRSKAERPPEQVSTSSGAVIGFNDFALDIEARADRAVRPRGSHERRIRSSSHICNAPAQGSQPPPQPASHPKA